MNKKRILAFIIVEVVIVITAVILSITDGSWIDLIIPFGLVILFFVYYLFFDLESLRHPKAPVCNILIILSLVSAVFAYHFLDRDPELSNMLSIISDILTVIWVGLSVRWLLVNNRTLKNAEKS